MSNFYQQQQQQQQPAHGEPANLQFYSSAPPPQHSAAFYGGARPVLDAHTRNDVVGAIGQGARGGGGGASGATYGGPIIVANWWNAFTPWTGTEGEPPLLEGDTPETHRRRARSWLTTPATAELGINFDHILQKSLTVMNPLGTIDQHIMDDADLAGPLVFCSVFASFLLLVGLQLDSCWDSELTAAARPQSGKPQFSYIYGVALVGSASIYALLNLMSESGIDAYRTASVLGYCLLPLVLLSMISVVASLE